MAPRPVSASSTVSGRVSGVLASAAASLSRRTNRTSKSLGRRVRFWSTTGGREVRAPSAQGRSPTPVTRAEKRARSTETNARAALRSKPTASSGEPSSDQCAKPTAVNRDNGLVRTIALVRCCRMPRSDLRSRAVGVPAPER